jgi:septal ring-binding cell division protein DamX
MACIQIKVGAKNLFSSLSHRYRLHQAYSRHPRLAFAGDIARNLCFVGLMAAIPWFIYATVAQQNNSPRTSIASISTPQNAPITTQAPEVKHTEIALASTVEAINTATTETELPILQPVDIEVPAVAKPNQQDNQLADISNAKVLTVATDPQHVYDAEWIMLLPEDKFTIQFGSSPDQRRLFEEARAFPSGQVAMFPFKKTPSNRLVYGYASGVYSSLDAAQRAIRKMPKSIVARGPWIRPIGSLKKQIAAVTEG